MNKKTVFSATIVLTAIISSAVLAEPGKCSPCQAAKSARDALQRSLKDAAAAALAAGKVRGAEVSDPEKCKPCQRTTRDEAAADIDDPAKCKPCQRTTRDEVAVSVAPDPSKEMVQACCSICEQPGSLGCQGENKARCVTCQQGMIKISLMEAAAAALAVVTAMSSTAEELDEIPTDDSKRAPREGLVDCSICDPVADCVSVCQINDQLCAIRNCCNKVNQRLECHAHASKRCCKKIRDDIEDVEELVESVIDITTDCCSLTESLLISVIDQSAECCSVVETVLGDPALGSALDLPLCLPSLSIVDIVNGIDADVITWLKSLFVLLYNVHICTCCLD